MNGAMIINNLFKKQIMKHIFLYISLVISCLSLRAQIAVKGEKVYTMPERYSPMGWYC